MHRLLRSPAAWTAALILLLAFAWLGSRGIWDPDEGRYTNVALHMLESGDWLNPRRSDDVGHWTKPPLTYWAIAASVGTFGYSPWAARLPGALAYLACVFFAWRLARRLAPGQERPAALAYALMPLTFGASQIITTDILLALWLGLALWAYVEARFGPPQHSGAWLALMWAGFALAFLTKGPPALLLLLAVAVYELLLPGRRAHRLFTATGLVLFALLALPWYVAVIRGHPGLLQHWLGDEVLHRIATNKFNRHGEWYGWLLVYGPTLTLGTLPWTAALGRWGRTLPAQLRRWRAAPARDADHAGLLLAVTVLLPLAVLLLARSRMPLYVLPLLLPLAVIVARQYAAEARPAPRWHFVLAWAAGLLAIKLGMVFWPTHKNAAEWAEAIVARAGAPVEEIAFVDDMARYGLHLHLGATVERITLTPTPQPAYDPVYDEPLAVELAEREPHVVWITKQALWPQVRAQIARNGYRAIPLGTPYRERVLFRVVPVPALTGDGESGSAPPAPR